MNYQEQEGYSEHRFIYNEVYASKGDTVMVTYLETFYRAVCEGWVGDQIVVCCIGSTNEVELLDGDSVNEVFTKEDFMYTRYVFRGQYYWEKKVEDSDYL